jgi:hypothetical protein
MPDTTAAAVISFPAHVPWGKIVSKALMNQATWRTPARLIAAGTHRPTSAMPQFASPEGWLKPNKAST